MQVTFGSRLSWALRQQTKEEEEGKIKPELRYLQLILNALYTTQNDWIVAGNNNKWISKEIKRTMKSGSDGIKCK